MSDKYDALIAAAEKKYGIPPGLLLAQKSTESGGDVRAVSKKGALGLMQFMPPTAKAYGVDPYDPVQAIDGAARYMRDNLKAAHGDPTEALRLYQGGPNRAGWGPENHAYPATVYGKMGDAGILTAMGLPTPDGAVAAAPGEDTPQAPPQVDEHATLAAAGLPTAANIDPQTAKDMGVTIDKDGALVVNVTGGHSPEIRFPFGTNAEHATQQVRALFAKGADPAEITSFIQQHGGSFANPDDAKQLFADYESDAGTGVDPRWKRGLAAHPDYSPFTVSIAPEPISAGESTATGLRNLGSMGWEDELTAYARSKLGLSPDGQGPAKLYSPGLTQNQIYDKALGIERAHSDAAWNQHPVAYAGGGAVGMLPSTVLAPGSTLPRMMATGAVLGGVSGAGNATEGNRLQQAAMGATLGAGMAPLGTAVGAVGRKAVNALVPKVDPIIASLAQKAADMGINVRGSQISSSPAMRTVDSVLARVPGSGIAADNEAQRAAFTRAVGNSFGADSDALTPEVMSAAKNRISDVYDTVGGRTTLDLNPENGSQFLDNIGRIQADAKGTLGTDKAPALEHLITNVLDKVGPDGTMSGAAFKALTSRGTMLDTATRSSDPVFASTAKAIKGELNSALTASAAPEDAVALRAANTQWKNMRTVEKLVAKSLDGTISPALLQNPVSTSFGNRAYTGAGALGDLGDIGQRFLKDQGSSNTAERNAILKFAANAGKVSGGIGAALLGVKSGISPGELLAMAGGAGGTLLGGRMAGKALMAPGYRNRLIDAALNGDNAAPGLPISEYLLPPAAILGNKLLPANGSPHR